MKIETYYNVFNLLTKSEDKANQILEGWEHKETIEKVYVVTDEDLNEYMENDVINLDVTNLYLFKTEQQAIEHMKEELEYM
jgi:hypothetical protein